MWCSAAAPLKVDEKHPAGEATEAEVLERLRARGQAAQTSPDSDYNSSPTAGRLFTERYD
ncbi:hypothetical protein FQA47_016651, partial [Oryzias melastigma]